MKTEDKDPSAPLRERARSYPDVVEGTACTQSSFKTGKTSFFFVGMQGGRHKAMFKLQESLPEAARLAEQQPENYAVGKIGWVTARFSAEHPLPEKLWQRWLDESHALSRSKKAKKKAPAKKKSPTKKKAKKKAPAKKKAKKKPAASS